MTRATSSWERVVFDIEADDLLPNVTKVHTIVVRDLETGEMISATDSSDKYEPLSAALDVLSKARQVWGHNAQDYDLPVLEKLLGFTTKAELRDTLILSRLMFPDIAATDFAAKKIPPRLAGRHSLEAWGYRLGERKSDFSEWSVWSPEMQRYCEQDTLVGMKLARMFDAKQWDERSIQLEHAFAAVIRRQEKRGFAFDLAKAAALYADLAAIRSQLHGELSGEAPPTVVKLKTPAHYIDPVTGATYTTKTSAPSAVRKRLEDGPRKERLVPFSPASRVQVARLLRERGWVPKSFTATGQAEVSEAILEGVEDPLAKKLARYFRVSKRIAQLSEGRQGWMKLVRDGRIHGSVNTNGAVTGRCTHNSPNMAQVPRVKVGKVEGKKVALYGEPGLWGADCRSLFIAGPGKVLVGTDASGLELRCLGHYLAAFDGGRYIAAVTEGDIHTTNQQAFGLPDDPACRDQAKTGIYAYVYGAANEKLGQSLERLEDQHEAAAQRAALPAYAKKAMARLGPITPQRVANWKRGFYARQSIEQRIPGLGTLMRLVSSRVASRGYLVGLDGRRLPVRKKHAALNTLLQSAGAVLVKQATVIFNNEIMPELGFVEGVDYGIVVHVHDEWQTEVCSGIEHEVGAAAVRSIGLAGDRLGFRCPLAAEYKVGNSWAETH